VAEIVLSDATAWIYLAQLPEGLSLLEGLFGQISITSIVKEEVLPQKSAPGEDQIKHAIETGLIVLVEDRWSEPIFPSLDIGEPAPRARPLISRDQGPTV
jgi:predicted nucleic acid-binding protein